MTATPSPATGRLLLWTTSGSADAARCSSRLAWEAAAAASRRAALPGDLVLVGGGSGMFGAAAALVSTRLMKVGSQEFLRRQVGACTDPYKL